MHISTLTIDLLAPAQDVLTPEQLDLFTQLQPSEQVHSLRVMRALQNQGENHPDLMVAALLHDLGKIRYPLRLWERILIVLANIFCPHKVEVWGNGNPRSWRRPFVIAKQHPLWGAELALGVNTSALTASLIRRHQTKLSENSSNSLEDQLLIRLQSADNRH
jgi:hypothetical protein